MRSLWPLAVVFAVLCGSSHAAALSPCDGGARSLFEDPEGVGGTGRDPGEEEGVGGTGRDAAEGVGGTGRAPGGEDEGVGGTGLFGTLVRRADSVCVAGHAVRLAPDIRVDVDGVPADTRALTSGEVAWLQANATDDGLVAHSASVLHAATGELGALDAEARRFEVAGREFQLLDSARVVDAASGDDQPLEALAPGDAVAVSALAGPDGRWFATRVTRGAEAGPDRMRTPDPLALANAAGMRELAVEGFIHEVGPEAAVIGGVPVALPRPATGLVPDARVWLRGAVGPSGARALQIQEPPMLAPRPVPPPGLEPLGPQGRFQPTPLVPQIGGVPRNGRNEPTPAPAGRVPRTPDRPSVAPRPAPAVDRASPGAQLQGRR